MFRLVWAGLLAGWRLWTGAFVLCVGTGVVLGVLSVFAGTVVHARYWLDALPDGPTYADLSEVAGMLSLLTVVPAVIVLAVVFGLLGQQTARQHATWRLAGARPSQVRTTIVVQAALTALVGSLVGVGLALPFGQRAVDGLSQIPGADRLHAHFAPLWLGADVATMLLVGLAAAVVPAFRASRRPAVEALEEPKPRRAMGKVRWVLLVVAGVVAAFGMVPPPGGLADIRQSHGDLHLTQQAVADWVDANMNAAIALMVLLAIAAPVVSPLVLRAWTAVVPSGRAPLWQLARHSAGAKLAVSTAATTPLMVAMVLFGVYFASSHTLSAVLYGGSLASSREQQGHDLIALTPAVALAVAGSVVVLAMISRDRDREMAVLRAQAATSRDMCTMMVLEAVIYAVTAAILAGFPLLTMAALNATGIRAARMPASYLHLALGFPGAAFGVGLFLMIAVVLGAGIPAIRRPAAKTLQMVPQ